MLETTKNEISLSLEILKSPEKDYNANNIVGKLGITPMGALKIMKRLEKDNILVSKRMGRAVFYKINNGSYAKSYFSFFLKREAEQASPYIKRWLNEIRKIKNAETAILFGSVLKKEEEANDIDVLFVATKTKFKKLKEEVEQLNKINPKRIHAIYQTRYDLKNNIKNMDKVILNAIKGIVVFGEENIVGILIEVDL